jgi:hypothetical protein
MATFDQIHDLREVPLMKCDFSALREEYGASKHGTHHLPMLVQRLAVPSYRLAAQMDLDCFHRGEDSVLDWDQLITEMFPEPDDRTAEERRNDQLAMTCDKG